MKRYKRRFNEGEVLTKNDVNLNDRVKVDDFTGNIYEGIVIRRYNESGYPYIDVKIDKIIRRAQGIEAPVKIGNINSLLLNKAGLKMKSIYII